LDELNALKNPHDLAVTLEITAVILVVIALNFFFRRSNLGYWVNSKFERLAFLGPILVRLAISASFFFSAQSMSFLGPELPLTQMPLAHVLQWALYAISVMILLGLFTEVAAVIGLIIFTIGLVVFKQYLLTYFNYLGELIVLMLFGMRRWSFDGWWFGS